HRRANPERDQCADRGRPFARANDRRGGRRQYLLCDLFLGGRTVRSGGRIPIKEIYATASVVNAERIVFHIKGSTGRLEPASSASHPAESPAEVERSAAILFARTRVPSFSLSFARHRQ